MTPAPTFHTMTRAELDQALDWGAAEQWNPGIEDAAAFHASDPQGFFAARLDGTMAGAISVVNHDPQNAFLGLYLVRPDLRGQGIGLALWTHALAHAGTRSIGLEGVAAQQDNYRRSGFVPLSETRRFVGTIPARRGAVRPATQADLALIAALDRAAVGHDRPAFLRAWTTPAATRGTLMALDGRGFVTWRHCRTGTKIGPVTAADAGTARMLLQAAAGCGPAPHVLDVPRGQAVLERFCTDAGMACSFATARMVRGPAPVFGGDAQGVISSVATLELG